MTSTIDLGLKDKIKDVDNNPLQVLQDALSYTRNLTRIKKMESEENQEQVTLNKETYNNMYQEILNLRKKYATIRLENDELERWVKVLIEILNKTNNDF